MGVQRNNEEERRARVEAILERLKAAKPPARKAALRAKRRSRRTVKKA
jgi:hypothetical protein